MIRRRRRRRKAKSNENSDEKKVEIRYPEDLVMAVKYLLEKDLNTREVADRLMISPYTVRNIKRILRKRGLLEAEESESKTPKKAATTKTKPRKHRDILDEILGLKKPVKKAATTKTKPRKHKDIIEKILGEG